MTTGIWYATLLDPKTSRIVAAKRTSQLDAESYTLQWAEGFWEETPAFRAITPEERDHMDSLPTPLEYVVKLEKKLNL